MAVSLHYLRLGQQVSLRGTCVRLKRQAILFVFGLVAVLPALGQYPGQITKKDNAPELRAVGVLEWTGEEGKPKFSRLVPITVFDGQELQDGGLYLARPQPLAVAGGVEYVLQQDGKRVGIFDIDSSGQEQGSWVGLGSWKPMPHPVVKPAAQQLADSDFDDAGSDKPVLHRKHRSGDSKGGDSTGGSSGSGSQAPASDPDRPTLHKKTSDDDTGNGGGSSDPDRPTLHKPSSSDDSASAPAADPDRPTLKKPKENKEKKPEADAGSVESVATDADPDRPRLLRGKPTGTGAPVAPTLMGLPPDMHQMVAVSDVQNKPEHPWDYTWANPGDEANMKSQLEDIARSALGIHAPPLASATKPKTARAKAKPAAPPPAPPPLADEQFRVLELAYGSGATLVLTAHTDGPLAQEKFVTLIAQPDLYGSLLILFKSVTDGSRLDENPRMRLVDAVDAMEDNRGELLFELRGETQRQFALYRVLRGTAEKLFVTGGGSFGSQAMN